ncbi:MAG: J domain-containing protein [Myxococcales bacterium]|nr:J domain-containing protein [Myxococcales bacterium]
MKTHYDTLGVPPNANGDMIRAAFRQLVKKYHPDGPQGNLQVYQQITEAYAVLSSPSARVDYDRHLAFLRGEDPDGESEGATPRPKIEDSAAPSQSGRRGLELIAALVVLLVALGAFLVFRYVGGATP